MITRFLGSMVAAGLAACLVACLGACTPIAFAEQEVSLRHDAEADAVRMLIVYDSVQATGTQAKHLASAERFVLRVTGGRRVFILFAWPFIFDLEQAFDSPAPLGPDSPGAPETRDASSRWERELADSLRGTQVLASGYCGGPHGRVSLYQDLRFAGVSRTLRVLQEGLHLWVAQAVAEGNLENATPLFDARTRELWIQAAEAQRPWLRLADGALEVDLPMTETTAATLFADSLRAAAESPQDTAGLAAMFGHLDSLCIADERVVLRWKLAGPIFTLRAPKDFVFDPALSERIRESKLLPDPLPQRAEIEARFLAREPQDR